MTSGNLAGEPIVTDDADALDRLLRSRTPGCPTTAGSTCPATTPSSRAVAGADLPVRRSRGYAPMPLSLPFDVPPRWPWEPT